MPGMLKTMTALVEKLERVEWHQSKYEIFKYETLDEANPAQDRGRGRDVTVEIGGPCAHIKFTIETRVEHTMIKEAVQAILGNRAKRLKTEFAARCHDYMAEIEI